ncbi:MAG: M28 family peptidase [Gemmatimonadota bacterium]|nr:M28 family peptidase [Gemmatimonadota bacterium]
MIRRERVSTFIAPAILALSTACMPPVAASTGSSPVSSSVAGEPPALSAIDTAQLRRDLYTLASDAMRGREAGTVDELRASVWEADQARKAGLQPAGDDGTYFQFWPMRRVRTSESSSASIDGTPLVLWRDAAVVSPVNARVDLPIIWVGTAAPDSVAKLDLHGKAAAAMILPAVRSPAAGVSLRSWRYTRVAMAERSSALEKAGAAAVILVADDSTDSQFIPVSVPMRRGSYNDDTGSDRVSTRPPVLWVPAALASRVASAKRLDLALTVDNFVYPSVNVVAKVPGTDATVRDQYVLFSGHSDHDGVRFPVNGDSIWNGADDNASVAVGILAIGRAFVQHPGRRSALFVWHGAEERGLLGSRWFAAHPTVPLSSVVAVLNGDMIGRNSPDSAALLGSQPPHRNSIALVQMALDANSRVTHFVVDSSWDRPTHPEGWYFRSDHLPYARAGVPSLFFTTLLHPDYHTPRDEASRIDYVKLARMARWMYATGWEVANAPARPAVDPGFRLER